MDEDTTAPVDNGAAGNCLNTSSVLPIEQMLRRRGGVIFEVSRIQDAKIAEEAGACAIVLSQSSCPCPTRMIDPSLITKFKEVVSIPVIARVRVGHFVEAQILQSVRVDYIDESEFLEPADSQNRINKARFKRPFICGSENLGEALKRIAEGAVMIRTQGIPSISGDIAATVRNVRSVKRDIGFLKNMDADEGQTLAGEIGVPFELVARTRQLSRLPAAQFAAGGIVTPADAALMMSLGCDGVFVEPQIFDWPDPYKRARGIVEAVNYYFDPIALVTATSGLN